MNMNRQWLQVSYPNGSLTLANFEYRESSLSDEPLQDVIEQMAAGGRIVICGQMSVLSWSVRR
jgi:hypothetical protein